MFFHIKTEKGSIYEKHEEIARDVLDSLYAFIHDGSLYHDIFC